MVCAKDGSQKCLECFQECVQMCQNGQYRDVDNKSCENCSDGCRNCSSLQVCKQCKDGMFLTSTNTCVSQCSEGYFKENIIQFNEQGESESKWVCSKCHHACIKCFGPDINQCESCFKFYTFTSPSTCKHPKCDANFYALNDKICIQCPPNCNSCTTNEVCYRCSQSYILLDGQCFNSDCKNDQIFSYTTRKCELCDSGCLECKGLTSYCTSCLQNYFMWNNKCLQTCPYGYTKKISSQLSQNSLQDGNSQLQNKNYCKSCHPDCADCVGETNADCSSCPPEKYLVVEKQQCQRSQKVNNCIIALSENICLQCDAYFYLQDNQCQTNCQIGYYPIRLDIEIGFLNIIPSFLCLPCQQGCDICTNQDQCIKCTNTYFELNQQTGACLPLPSRKLCQSGYFWDIKENICLKCMKYCTQCKTQEICLKCTSDFILINSACKPRTECPIKTYYNYKLRSCEMCNTACLVCSDYQTCLQCYDQTDVLFDNQCIHQCPSSYFRSIQDLNNPKCLKCHETCLECKGPLITDCTVCQEGSDYYKHLSICLPQCQQQGQYYDQVQKKCLQCMKKCNQCQQYKICLECNEGMYFDFDESMCQICMKGCKSCKNYQTCDQCEIDSVYLNGNCQKRCTVRDFNCVECNQQTNECKACQSGEPVQSNGFCKVSCKIKNCQRCLSSSQCALCEEEFYLDINQTCQLRDCKIQNCQNCSFEKLIPECILCKEGYQITQDGFCSTKKVVLYSIYIKIQKLLPKVQIFEFFNFIYSKVQKYFIKLFKILIYEKQIKKKCPQYDNQCIECQDEKSCKICKKSFYYSSEYNQCLTCKDRCLKCNEFQCFEYNTCQDGEYMLEKQCVNCHEQCDTCNGPSANDCIVSNKEKNCHYTCTECLGSNYNECISCPQNRILTFYFNAKYGECKCPQGTYDILEVKCMEGYLDQVQRDLTVGFCYLGAIGVIAQSLISVNPALFYLLSEFAQTLGQIQYINIKKAYDFDETMYVLQHFNYNILSGVGSNVKPVEKQNQNRILEVRLEDLEKITSFYKTNNFIKNSKVLIILNVVCLNLMLLSSYLVQNKKLRQYKKLSAFLRILRFSLPAFTLVLTSSEMCVTIQLQMKEFDLDSDQAFALILSIILFTYQFVWIVVIIIQLGIKNSIKKKKHQIIFTIFNRKSFWQRIFLALLFMKKQFLSIILINVFKTPIKVLFIQLSTEAIFGIYIVAMNPYRGAIYTRFALLNQFTYILANFFLILISSNEDSDSQLKPILYIFILSLILSVLVLYSIFSFYLIVKTVMNKVSNNLINKVDNQPILSPQRQQLVSLRNQYENGVHNNYNQNHDNAGSMYQRNQIVNTELIQLNLEEQNKEIQS